MSSFTKQNQPCGTLAAFHRHYRAGEKPCQKCKKTKAEMDKRTKARRRAKAEKDKSTASPAMNSTSRAARALEAAMEKDPPVIRWRFDPIRRVQVAWHVYDPHAEKGA